MTDTISNYAHDSLAGRERLSPRTLVSKLAHRMQTVWKTIVVGIPYFWLLLFFLAPFVIVLKISLAESLIASPPFSPLFEWTEEGILTFQLLFENYSYLWEDALYVKTYLNSLKISTI